MSLEVTQSIHPFMKFNRLIFGVEVQPLDMSSRSSRTRIGCR
jgi:hypothetical protein